MSVRKLLLGWLLLSTTAMAQQLSVAAASDLGPALKKLIPAFEKQTGVRTKVALGSSGNFFAQIQNGAPFDVFLSADRGYPEKLAQAGKAERDTLTVYARGILVIWWGNNVPLSLRADKSRALSGDLKELAGPAVRRIAIANPEHAPYGRAAEAVLRHYGIYEQLKPRLVLGENVGQAAQFAESGNAEVALIPWSLALTPAMQEKGKFLFPPQGVYQLDQAGVVPSSSQHKSDAKKFLQFLHSAAAEEIFANSGFGAPAK